MTGAGTGLGRGIAQQLAEAGASIARVEIDADLAAEGFRRLVEEPDSVTKVLVDMNLAAGRISA